MNFNVNVYRLTYYNICNFLEFPLIIISWNFDTGKRACRFPGDPKNGRVTPVKFLYELGDRILIQVNAAIIYSN